MVERATHHFLNIGFCCFSTPGGSGVVACELARWMAARGHHLHFIGDALPLRFREAVPNRVHTHLSPAQPGSAIEEQARRLSQHITHVHQKAHLDILHVHYALPHAIAAWQACKSLLFPPALVITLHGTDVFKPELNGTSMRDLQAAFNHASAITTVSHYLNQQARLVYRLQKDIQTIHNFVDTEVYKPLNTLPHSKTRSILHNSNFKKIKRSPDVIRIFKSISKEIPAQLTMIGDGEEKKKVCEMVERGKLQNKVRYSGTLIHPEHQLARADLFLLPSENESFGLAALEALACGVPVVASNTGGLPELIKPGLNGELCPRGNIGVFKKACLHILKDKNLNVYRHRARQSCVENFAIEKKAPEYEDLYFKLHEQFLDKKRSGSRRSQWRSRLDHLPALGS